MLIRNVSSHIQATIIIGGVKYIIEPNSMERIPDEFYEETIRNVKDANHLKLEWEEDIAAEVLLQASALGDNVREALDNLNNTKASKSIPLNNGNVAILDLNGDIDDSGISISNISQGIRLADMAEKSYQSLDDKPTHSQIFDDEPYKHRPLDDFSIRPDALWSSLKINTEINDKIEQLVDSAPSALNTLNEIAAALNNDPTFGSAMITMLSGKSDILHTHNLSDLSEKSFNSLTDVPIIPTRHSDLIDNEQSKHRRINDLGTSQVELWSSYKINEELSSKSDDSHIHLEKADKVVGGFTGNLVSLTPSGNITDSNFKPSDFELSGSTNTHETDYDHSLIHQKNEDEYINLPFAFNGRTVFVDGNRVDNYTPNGTTIKPFKTIQSAIDYIGLQADNKAYPFVIDIIGPGSYFETLDFNNDELRKLVIIGHQSVRIEPPSGQDAINITSNNNNFDYLFFHGINFYKPIRIEGWSSQEEPFRNSGIWRHGGLVFKDCLIGDLAPVYLYNIFDVKFDNCEINSSLQITNVVFTTINGGKGHTGGVTTFTYDNSQKRPLGLGTPSYPRPVLNILNTIDKSSWILSENTLVNVNNSTIGDTTGPISVSGEIIAITSWIKANAIVIQNTGRLITKGTFFNPDNITVNGNGYYESKTDIKNIVYNANNLSNWDGNNPSNASHALDILAETKNIDNYGTAINRPQNPATGERYFDTTLGKPIWFSGSSWVDANGSLV